MVLNEFKFLELYNGNLPVENILNKTYLNLNDKNFGAIINFIGVIREENKIDGLSFDVYKPILDSWFNSWQEKAQQLNATIQMFHSVGNVHLFKSSFIAIVASPKRRVALELMDEFVEDFKANAPIWKYDIINGKRVYAKDRSSEIKSSGLLS
jgi:molybdopterin synthase catalytic subunit